ncbi:molybdopterin-binding protein [Shimia sp. SDUM112013]|uniref:molybdopterin-binding protein n=1 Tax=Shimia sp. SDUM112013 TaxID=3136160 RepID=UPI0032EE5734
MKFGPVPVAEAEGGILAHSVKAGNVRLRKGQTLGPDHIHSLQGAGLSEVVIARLGPEDLHEDAAASQLAQALVPDPDAANLRLTDAFTGRVNITAACPGVVEMDVAALDALNAVHPMVTLATVPPWQQMGTGNMVGTVKMISYGVPAADVMRGCDLARCALRLRPVVYKTVSLIITEIPGGVGDKGKDAVEGRVRALGMTLAEVLRVPHREAELAEAIAGAHGDLVLILTGSATSDVQDVAPTALRAAGGQVTRFGMPVDPGNLLFLGDKGDVPVIGLPGCARSPALNGADWVLSRVACGVSVTSADIAVMGVGGLLKEIPTRPMPRERRR